MQMISLLHAISLRPLERTRAFGMTHSGSGAIPEKLWRAKEPALLTVLFTTKKGEVGLMNIYAGVTIVEMNSRYGAVGNGRR